MRAAVFLLFLALWPAARADALQEAQTHWYAGRPDEALSRLDAALRDHPQDARLRFTQAWMLQERGEVSRAETLLTRLIEDFPDLAEAHNNLAVLLAARGDLDAALVHLQRAVLVQPLHVQAQENLGDLLVRMAQRAYTRAAQGATPRTALTLKLQRLNDWIHRAPE